MAMPKVAGKSGLAKRRLPWGLSSGRAASWPVMSNMPVMVKLALSGVVELMATESTPGSWRRRAMSGWKKAVSAL